MCQRLYNISLKYDEFCVEEMYENNSALMVGSPVWQHFKTENWTDSFGFFVGLINKAWKEDEKWVGVVKKVGTNNTLI